MPDLGQEPEDAEDAVDRGVAENSPNVARMYDYYLGGKDNYAADRATAERVLSRFPELRAVARENRAFLNRVVRFLVAECGIHQFLDIGSGLPTQSNVHQVAQEVDPDARVVYVDNDPVVVVHARALLAGDGHTAVIEGDLRDPGAILREVRARELIDFDQPVATLLSAVLHFVPDSDDPYGGVGQLRDALSPGSVLVITHAGGEDMPDRAREAAGEYRGATAQLTFRTRGEIMRFFEGLKLLAPGLVALSAWRNPRPPQPEQVKDVAKAGLAGVARKP